MNTAEKMNKYLFYAKFYIKGKYQSLKFIWLYAENLHKIHFIYNFIKLKLLFKSW